MFLYALQNIVNMLKTAEFHWNFFAKFNIIIEDSVLVSSLFIIPVTVPGGGQEAAVRAVAPLCHELSLATSHSHQLSTCYRAGDTLSLTSVSSSHNNLQVWGDKICHNFQPYILISWYAQCNADMLKHKLHRRTESHSKEFRILSFQAWATENIVDIHINISFYYQTG